MSLNEQYVQNMAYHGLGQALFHPVQASELRIGDAGFFDGEGKWNRIGHITDAAALAKKNLKPDSGSLLDKAPLDKNIEWGPLKAEHVKGKNISAGANVSSENGALPAAASFQVEYSSSTAFGAVLACISPIYREAYYFSDPFKSWALSNVDELASSPIINDLKKWGLFIVTQTYAAKKYTLTTWNTANESVSLGFDIDVEGGAKLKVGSAWYEGRSVTGWRGGGSTDENDEPRVVFVSGVIGKLTNKFWSKDVKLRMRSDEMVDFEEIGKLPIDPRKKDELEEDL